MNLSELNLDIRTFNAVCRAGFKTAEELFQAMGENQERVRLLVGRNSFDKIDEAFAELEDKGMLEFTTKLPPAPAEATTPEYLAAFNLNARIHYCKDSVERGLAEMCIGIEQMRDGKQYKALGYSNFEEYCQTEFGFTRKNGERYASIGKMLSGENATSMSQNAESLGMTKLSLLAKLDEPTREALTETIDVESVTVKELKAQITALTAERDENEHAAALLSEELDSAKESLASKDKQFKEAMETKDKQLKAVKESGEQSLSECKTYLNGRIHELENRIREMDNAPIDHEMTDADAAEEIKRLKKELEDERLRYAVMEGGMEAKARRAADEVRHQMTRMHEEELQTLREGYEKQLEDAGLDAASKQELRDEGYIKALKDRFEDVIDALESYIEDLTPGEILKHMKAIDEYYRHNLLYLLEDSSEKV